MTVVQRKSYLLLALLCGAMLVELGCSSASKDRQKTYKVTGKVTLNGAPVANASVTYSPVDKQPVAVGRTNDAGEFSLTTYTAGDGAVAGKYVVMVSKEGGSTGAGGPPAGGHDAGKAFDSKAAHSATKKSSSGGGSSSTSLLPEKYSTAKTSPLAVTVEEKANQHDHDLK